MISGPLFKKQVSESTTVVGTVLGYAKVFALTRICCTPNWWLTHFHQWNRVYFNRWRTVHAKHVVFCSSHLRNHVSDLKFFSEESLSLIWAQLFSDPEHIVVFRLWFYSVSLFSQQLNEVNRWIKLSPCLIEPLNGKFYVTLKQNKGKWPKVKMDLIHDQS